MTLVEALVSLVVLSLGLIPAIGILSSSVRLASLIKNNLIAANLAQEGVEIVRGLRDEDWFKNPAVPFGTGIVGSWLVDWNTSLISGSANLPQLADTNPPLKFDPTTKLYNYTTGIETNFKRYVSVTMAANPCLCELIVISRVEWSQQGTARIQNVEAHLFDWK